MGSDRYLRGYCQRFDLDVATDTEVLSVGRERSDGGREFVGAAGGVIRVRIRRYTSKSKYFKLDFSQEARACTVEEHVYLRTYFSVEHRHHLINVS